ncbi:MAG: hypothetical protein AB7H66_08520 [Hyphomonadaceae bacterium]
MAQAYETRHRRNGAIDLRDDMATLQKDFSRLGDDIGGLIKTEWDSVGKRVDGGVKYMHGQVRKRPIAAVGVAAGVGLLAGLAFALRPRRK